MVVFKLMIRNLIKKVIWVKNIKAMGSTHLLIKGRQNSQFQ
jgi:hypothetical protein